MENHSPCRITPDDLAALDGFGKKSADRLYHSIQQSRSVSLDRFLVALGIRHVGDHLARVLAAKYKKLNVLRKAEFDALVKINEVGQEVARSIVYFFSNEGNIRMLGELKKLGVKVLPFHAEDSGKLSEMAFVLTGELEKFTRDEAKERIESLGGKITSSVSGKTDYLVMGENPGKKLDEARKRDVEVLDEGEFLNMLPSLFFQLLITLQVAPGPCFLSCMPCFPN